MIQLTSELYTWEVKTGATKCSRTSVHDLLTVINDTVSIRFIY
jgi:hypothetical protein